LAGFLAITLYKFKTYEKPVEEEDQSKNDPEPSKEIKGNEGSKVWKTRSAARIFSLKNFSPPKNFN